LKKSFSVLLIFICFHVQSQELFIQTEPASTVPKGVLGIRATAEGFKEHDRLRQMFSLKLMYGLTPKWTIMAEPTLSNHHSKNLPVDLVNHYHIGSSHFYFTNKKVYGLKYKFLFDGVYLYSRYRFFSIDGEKRHFRMAAFGEYSITNTAHDEAEPNLVGDNKGWGTGLIVTQLYKKLAISVTSGAIFPVKYSEQTSVLTEVYYGRAIHYSLSIGYLIYPKEYENYQQNNYNLYLEFLGKSYETARVFQNSIEIPVQSPTLKKGSYIEVYPGIQKITGSNNRLDISVGLPLANRSYARFYPVLRLGFQHYFY
jgi:hypothetical protein